MWYLHWDFSIDLSRGGVELSFRNPEEMAMLLVETEAVKRFSGIINNITASGISPRYHLVGARGLGKSTMLNFAAYTLLSKLADLRTAPIFVSLFGTAVDERDLEFIFFRSCLEGIFDFADSLVRYGYKDSFNLIISRLEDANKEYKEQMKKFAQVSIEYIYTAFENQLKHLAENFPRIVFLVDGLDKQNTEIVLKFFRNTQERFNSIISKFNCVFIYAAHPTWQQILETREFSGVRGTPFYLRGWTVSEVESLIRKRLETLGVFKIPFDREAIEVLVENFQGNPREILQYATTLLHYAARHKISTIGPGLLRKIIWNKENEQKLFEAITTNTDIRFAYEKLKAICQNRQIMNILIATYEQKGHRLSTILDFEKRSALGITLDDATFNRYIKLLLNRGCLRRSKVTNFVELDDDILKLFNFVVDLDQPLITLPVVLEELDTRILEIQPKEPERVSLRDEIKKVFEANPRFWMNYKEVEKILYENPRRMEKIQDSLGEDYAQKVKKSIPLVVGKLYEQGELMFDRESKKFRWRPKIIDVDTVDALPYAHVLDKLESIKEYLLEKNFSDFLQLCKGLLNWGWDKLGHIFTFDLKNASIKEKREFLQMLKIQTDKPIPLGLLCKLHQKTPSDEDEAQILLSSTLAYLKRIANVYEIFQKYEKIANLKHSKIIECLIGLSKENERRLFKKRLLPILLKNYGKLLEIMDTLKSIKGYCDHIPKELSSLLETNLILESRLYQCPKCGAEQPIAAKEVQEVKCPKDKTAMRYIKDVFTCSNNLYEAWTVWLEEYSTYMIQRLPCKLIGSGLCLKPVEMNRISRSYEIDGAFIFKDLAIAVECIENVYCSNEKNDVKNIVAKLETLDLFDAVMLIYRKVDQSNLFDATIREHEKIVYPVMVQSPKKFKKDLFETLLRMDKNLH